MNWNKHLRLENVVIEYIFINLTPLFEHCDNVWRITVSTWNENSSGERNVLF